MPEYDDTNKIALWKNDQEGNDARPVLRGTVNVAGKDYKVSLWKRDSENPNAPVLGGTIEDADASQKAAETPAADKGGSDPGYF